MPRKKAKKGDPKAGGAGQDLPQDDSDDVVGRGGDMGGDGGGKDEDSFRFCAADGDDSADGAGAEKTGDTDGAAALSVEAARILLDDFHAENLDDDDFLFLG